MYVTTNQYAITEFTSSEISYQSHKKMPRPFRPGQKNMGKPIDILTHVCYNIDVVKRGTARPPTKGGDNMTVLEAIGLLNLLAVVIFGVINITKKK